MREIIFSRLSAHVDLGTLVSDRIYPVNMEDVKPLVPYIVYRLGVSNPRIVPARSSNFQVWAHDNRGDYTRIDIVLGYVKEALISQGTTDYFEIRWLDDSEDLYDESSATITRYSRFDMVHNL